MSSIAGLVEALGRLGVNLHAQERADDSANEFEYLGVTNLTSDQDSRTLGPNACYHELHFEYPAMNLVPGDATPYLWKPRNIHHRESPCMASFHHDVNNLAFFARFDTRINVINSALPKPVQHEDMVSAINRLADSPGVSNLEVVAFLANDGVQYRTRLRTTWLAEDSSFVETHVWNYTGLEWGNFMTHAIEHGSDDISWAPLLQHLMDRASDRAYLHVCERLRARSSDLAYAHDQEWILQWDTAMLSSPNSLLVEKLSWHEDIGAVFPCACIVPDLSAFYLMNVTTEEEAAMFLCPVCSAPVLNDEETRVAFFHLEQRQDRRARLKAKIDEQCWIFLPSQLREGYSYRPFEVAHADLLDALQDTLSTFQLPESVLPQETCPTGFAETAAVTLRFSAILNIDETKSIKITPDSMPGYLLETAENVLRMDAGLMKGSTIELSSILPVGYREFLLRWFSRAVTLLAYQVQKHDDRVADELMAFMLNRRNCYDGQGTSWWAHPVR